MKIEFQGSKTLQPFSPRWTDPELLEKTLTGRRDLVDRLEQLVLEGAGGPNKYQRLIIGPRGSGKTHVMKVLHTRLWRNTELKDRLLIIYLLEDELGVSSFLDFLVRLLKAIIAWYPENSALARNLDLLYDLPPKEQQRRAIDLLLGAAQHRDLLIIMENLGVTFDDIHGFGRKGQQALRDLVQQYPRFLIVASAQALLDGVSMPNAPFYEFFSTTYLKKLTLEEAMEMLASVAAAHGNGRISTFLGTAEGRSRVRAIYEFTGGNHRLLVTFFNFLSADSVSRISDAFLEVLQPLKPYYQEQMRSLSSQQQKIVQFLSLKRTPQTVKDIARGSLATSNTVSSQMKALLDKGFVARMQHGRESYYEISETLFRICCEADLDHQGAPIRLFVDFLGNFYTAQELEARARGFHLLAQTLREEKHEVESGFYQEALQQYHRRELPYVEDGLGVAEGLKKFFHELSERRAYDEIISFAGHLGVSKETEIIVAEAEARAGRGDISGACDLLYREAESKPGNVDLYAKLARLLQRKGDLANAEIRCRQALDLDSTNEMALRTLAFVLSKTRRWVEAAEELRIVVSNTESVKAADLIFLGSLERRIGQMQRAEETWQKAALAEPDNIDPRLMLASLLASQDRFLESEPMLREAVQKWPDSAMLRMRLGAVLINTDRPAECLEQIRIAQRLEPHVVGYFYLGGLAAQASANLTVAEENFRQATRIEPDLADGWIYLAEIFTATDRLADAINALNTAADRNAIQPSIWVRAGNVWGELGILEKSEAAFRRAMESNVIAAVRPLARVLMKTGRLKEAEDILRALIDKDPTNARAREHLSGILVQTDLSAALEQVLAVQILEPENARAYFFAGFAALLLNKLSLAEQQLRRALELDETLVEATVHLAKLLAGSERYAEAIDLLTAAPKGEGDAKLLAARAEVEEARGDFAAAVANYEASLAIGGGQTSTLLNFSTLLIKLGRLDEAATKAKMGVDGSHVDELTDGLRLNLVAIFFLCSPTQAPTYLDAVLDALSQQAKMTAFERAASLSVFDLLRAAADTSEDRLHDAIKILDYVAARGANMTVLMQFVKVGIAYFKQNDRKALMDLPREERAVFMHELGIEEPN